MGSASKDRVRSVSSHQNSWIKLLRKAFAGGGPSDDVCAIESLHIVQEAARSGVRFRALFFTPAQARNAEALLDKIEGRPEAIAVSGEILSSAVATQTPQGIAALIEPPAWQLSSLLARTAPLFLCSAGLQDPGNIGTILRSAEAFGVTALLCLPGTANVWNAKSVRASAGSVFRLPSVKIAPESLGLLRNQGIRFFSTAASNGLSPSKANLRQPCAVFIGSEGAGIPASLLPLMDENLTIPQKTVESINAAVAASIICYEAACQRGR